MSAKHTDIENAVHTTIQGLDLSGIPDGQVVKARLPLDRNLTLTTVFVCKVGTEKEFPGTIGADDWGFPVLVVLVTPANQDNTPSDTETQWRESIVNAFHNKRLAGVASVWRCIVEPASIIDPALFREANLAVSQLVVRAVSRRVRT